MEWIINEENNIKRWTWTKGLNVRYNIPFQAKDPLPTSRKSPIEVMLQPMRDFLQ
jgi:hypothetical protein